MRYVDHLRYERDVADEGRQHKGGAPGAFFVENPNEFLRFAERYLGYAYEEQNGRLMKRRSGVRKSVDFVAFGHFDDGRNSVEFEMLFYENDPTYQHVSSPLINVHAHVNIVNRHGRRLTYPQFLATRNAGLDRDWEYLQLAQFNVRRVLPEVEGALLSGCLVRFVRVHALENQRTFYGVDPQTARTIECGGKSAPLVTGIRTRWQRARDTFAD